MRDIKEYLHNNRHMQESMEVHQNKKNEFYQTNTFLAEGDQEELLSEGFTIV